MSDKITIEDTMPLKADREAIFDEILELIEKEKYVFEREKDDYLTEVYKHLKAKNEARNEIIFKLKELKNE